MYSLASPHLLLANALVASAASRRPATHDSFTSIPLTQYGRPGNLAHHAIHAVAKHSGHHFNRGGFALEPEVLDNGFWYGAFDVGDSKNLSLLIDTGSPDVAVNPNLYKPSNGSLNLHESGALRYITVDEDGCGTANISFTTFADTVSQAGLVARNQTLGNVIYMPPPNNGTITQFPHQGVVGFSVPPNNMTQLDGRPFFLSLCDQGAVRECRFGLAYGTEGTGTQVLGGIDRVLIEGELDIAPTDSTYEVVGNVTLNNTAALSNQTFVFDSGTANIVGPPDQVRALFDSLGIQAVEQNLPGCTTVLFGYYPCDAPPAFGYQISEDGPAFNIEPSAFQQADNGNNNCTAIVTGIDFGFWIVGQAWFQGKYVDFDVAKSQFGVADLRNMSSGGWW